MTAGPDFSDLLAETSRDLARFWDEVLTIEPGWDGRLREAMRYSLQAGGKGLRPALARLAGRAYGAPEADLLAAGAALEAVHTYSLIHDDLPAMDNDDLRRGKPTNHKVFGEAMAILAGDGLLTLAFEIVATRVSRKEAVPELVRLLAEGAGFRGMVGGQAADLTAEKEAPTLPRVEYIHRCKTAALIRTSLLLGAVLGRASEADLARVRDIGDNIGLAFQVQDDLLDEEGSAAETGKAVRKDRERGKMTYPAVAGLDGSRAALAKATEQARSLLAGLPLEAPLAAALEFLSRRTR